MQCSPKWQDRQTLVTFMQTVSKVGAVTPECLFLILFSNKAAAFSNLKKVISIYSAVLLLLIIDRAS